MIQDQIYSQPPLHDLFPLIGPLSKEKGVSLEASPEPNFKQTEIEGAKQTNFSKRWNGQGLDGQLPLLSCFPAQNLQVNCRVSDWKKQT